ncbi:MAG: endolytic transglycosylase MltG [Candidatus Thiodiazotropha sp.]
MNRLIGIIIFVLSLLLAWGWLEYDDFVQKPLNLPPDGLNYHLHTGTSLRGLADDLQQKAIIQKPILLEILARWSGKAGQLKAGEYYLPADTTPSKLLQILSSAKVVQHALTIIEGWTFKQLMSAVRANPVLVKRLDGLDDGEIMTRLGYENEHPEGRFYPDTYHFPKGTTDVEFLQRAYRRMQKTLQAAWAKRAADLPLKTPYEALILASIIERETGLPHERREIAGVFIRRLKRGMLLQTDPTVIYGMGVHYDSSYLASVRRSTGRAHAGNRGSSLAD